MAHAVAPQAATPELGVANRHSVAAASDLRAQDREPPIVIMRLPQVAQRIGLCRSAIYARMSPDSKYFEPSFPRPISLSGPGTHGTCHRRRAAVGWIESEVETYLSQLRAARA